MKKGELKFLEQNFYIFILGYIEKALLLKSLEYYVNSLIFTLNLWNYLELQINKPC